MQVDSTNCRNVLGDALYLIRLPTMALEDFANDAAQSGILTLQETTDVFLCFTARNKPSISYRYLAHYSVIDIKSNSLSVWFRYQ